MAAIVRLEVPPLSICCDLIFYDVLVPLVSPGLVCKIKIRISGNQEEGNRVISGTRRGTIG